MLAFVPLLVPTAAAQPCGVSSLGDADGLLLGEDPPADIGSVVLAAPALGTQNRAPFLIGAPFDEDGDTNAGAVYVVEQLIAGQRNVASVATKVTGHRAGLRAGNAAATSSALWVGAPGDSANRGAIYVLTWPPKEPTLEDAPRILGQSAGDGFGTTIVSGPAPWDGGLAVAVGAPEAGTGGRVYVFDEGLPLPASRSDATLVVTDVTPGEQLGSAIALGISTATASVTWPWAHPRWDLVACTSSMGH